MSLKKFLKAAQTIQAKQSEVSEDYEPQNHDESNWLVSYADMMTLLCGFFIMLFSMAKLDAPQFEKVKEAMSKQFGGTYQSPNQRLGKFVTEVLEQAGVQKDATVQVEPQGVSIVFQATVFYDTLGADVKPEGKLLMQKLIASIATRQESEQKKYKIVIEGHTDSRPVLSGIYPTNWELSAARAAGVVRMFLGHGFEPASLTAVGYADTRPLAPARNPAGEWDESALAKSRRVVVRILNPEVEYLPGAPPTIQQTLKEAQQSAEKMAHPEINSPETTAH